MIDWLCLDDDDDGKKTGKTPSMSSRFLTSVAEVIEPLGNKAPSLAVGGRRRTRRRRGASFAASGRRFVAADSADADAAGSGGTIICCRCSRSPVATCRALRRGQAREKHGSDADDEKRTMALTQRTHARERLPLYFSLFALTLVLLSKKESAEKITLSFRDVVSSSCFFVSLQT